MSQATQSTQPETTENQSGHQATRGYLTSKDDYLKRLRRIEGQVGGVAKMVVDDRYCIDILTQISAATRALETVALGLLDDHMRHCVAQAVQQGGDEAETKLTEAREAIARLVRS
ncbi:MAG: metal-sensitive transcriptional regulator [Micropruina glycogenica]|jgi:CsoR family transcriptional regulator, copper-sensing transcriptional repressor|uniref:Copper-sensing transcriptional repressor RicR n=1 Tax=Micropruina glycogenica TaxID=75385 RepID=A0A2N9JJJ3_9ACTN|nr:metal-sensitive transcriptional regulator [Micropruina glycogenica]MCB0890565.1 metal-sensitive transcriptional regulator [Propionibacteriaceae bacterium]SPD87753.1 Copper-sensing transcriptional repressor RicR [Micropruina glycogenica]